MRGLLYTFFAVGTCVSAMTPSHGDRLSVPEPTQHELQKRRGGGSHGGGGGGGGGYYGPDYAAVTTCGLIPYAIAKQRGLWGTDYATQIVTDETTTSFSVICEGLCANQGNYLGCISYKTASIPTACVDYATDASTCTRDQACYWDLHCSSMSPYCNQNIYSQSITQFTCGFNKHEPITMEAVSMTKYTPTPANATSVGLTAPTSFSDALSKVHLSIGAFVGICIGLVVCCGGITGLWFWRCCRHRRSGRKHINRPTQYAPQVYEPMYHKPVTGEQPPPFTQQHYNQYQH